MSGRIFITSDCHFYHSNIILYEKLPFNNAEEMNERIISEWNKVVNPDDIVYILGDMFFCSKELAKEIMDRLNGVKAIVLGNHDRHGVQWYLDVGFSEVNKHPIILNGYIYLSHYPPEYIPANTPNVYLYGHVHNSKDYLTIGEQSACMCITRWNYKPVLLDTILMYMDIFRKDVEQLNQRQEFYLAQNLG